jgi:hypothetical protein
MVSTMGSTLGSTFSSALHVVPGDGHTTRKCTLFSAIELFILQESHYQFRAEMRLVYLAHSSSSVRDGSNWFVMFRTATLCSFNL